MGRDLRAPRAAGAAGLLFSVLFIASLLLFTARVPDAYPPSSDASTGSSASGT